MHLKCSNCIVIVYTFAMKVVFFLNTLSSKNVSWVEYSFCVLKSAFVIDLICTLTDLNFVQLMQDHPL